jgi:hypothetical protein
VRALLSCSCACHCQCHHLAVGVGSSPESRGHAGTRAGGCRRRRHRPWWRWLSRPSSRRRRPRRTPSPTSRPRSPVRADMHIRHMLRNLFPFVHAYVVVVASAWLTEEELMSRGRREARADQAPQVGQGVAVHDQVRRHLHPRRRRRARRGAPQREEVK